MTIAVSVKVNDGIVLAADSAATLMGNDGSGNMTILNVYNNANKIFNLRKGLPVGAMTWGQGAIGNASISALVKDLRARFHGDKGDAKWKIPVGKPYKVADIAWRLREFIYDEHYQPAYADLADSEEPVLGFL